MTHTHLLQVIALCLIIAFKNADSFMQASSKGLHRNVPPRNAPVNKLCYFWIQQQQRKPQYTCCWQYSPRSAFTDGKVKEFDYLTLPTGTEIPPPPKLTFPARFMCDTSWANSVSEFFNGYEHQDSTGSHSSMILAIQGCRRSGKTRALLEIDEILRTKSTQSICPIYISLSGWGEVKPEEKLDCIRAICLRIIFAATRDVNTDKNLTSEFAAFRRKCMSVTINQNCLLDWMKDNCIALLIDDLDHLIDHDEGNLETILEVADFINTMASEQHIIFSTDDSSILESMGRSKRTVGCKHKQVVIHPPLATNISLLAMCGLPNVENSDITQHHQIMGLIVDAWLYRNGTSGYQSVHQNALENYNAATQHGDPNGMFLDLLRSMINGDLALLHRSLHGLVNKPECPLKKKLKCQWITSHALYILQHARITDPDLHKNRLILVELLQWRLFCKKESGIDLESKCVFTIVARIIIHEPDGAVLPEYWFNTTNKLVYNFFDASGTGGKGLNDCLRWCDVLKAIKWSDFGPAPCIAVYFFKENKFETFDAACIYIVNSTPVERRGIQCKEGVGRINPAADLSGMDIVIVISLSAPCNPRSREMGTGTSVQVMTISAGQRDHFQGEFKQ